LFALWMILLTSVTTIADGFPVNYWNRMPSGLPFDWVEFIQNNPELFCETNMIHITATEADLQAPAGVSKIYLKQGNMPTASFAKLSTVPATMMVDSIIYYGEVIEPDETLLGQLAFSPALAQQLASLGIETVQRLYANAIPGEMKTGLIEDVFFEYDRAEYWIGWWEPGTNTLDVVFDELSQVLGEENVELVPKTSEFEYYPDPDSPPSCTSWDVLLPEQYAMHEINLDSSVTGAGFLEAHDILCGKSDSIIKVLIRKRILVQVLNYMLIWHQMLIWN